MIVKGKSNIILDNFFKVEETELIDQNEDGTINSKFKRLNVNNKDSVAAVVYNIDTDKIVLVRQFRYSVFKKFNISRFFEIPTGLVEAGEHLIPALRREILEETGYEQKDDKKFVFLTTFFPLAGITSETTSIYLVIVGDENKVSSGGGVKEENEIIEVVEVSFKDMEHYINGIIEDGKSLIGLMFAKDKILQYRTENNASKGIII